jgi:protein-arginine kinase activator protein McsA
MASNYTCDVCQKVQADFVITMILNGDTIAVGVECIKKWATEIDKAYRAAAQAEQDAATTAQEAATAAEGTWEDGYPQGRPDEAAEATGDTQEAQGSDTTPASASNE